MKKGFGLPLLRSCLHSLCTGRIVIDPIVFTIVKRDCLRSEVAFHLDRLGKPAGAVPGTVDADVQLFDPAHVFSFQRAMIGLAGFHHDQIIGIDG